MNDRFGSRRYARLGVWIVLACWTASVFAADRVPRAAERCVVLADFDQTIPRTRSSSGVTAAVAEPPRPVNRDERNAAPQREAGGDGHPTADASAGSNEAPSAEPLLPAGKACRISSGGSGGVAFSSEDWPTDWRTNAALSAWVFRQPTDDRPDTIELRCVENDGRAHFWRKVELRHSGWKRVEVPLSAMRWGDQRAPRWDKVKNLVLFLRERSDLWIDSVSLSVGPDNDAAELAGERLARLAFPQSDAAAVTIVRRELVELITDCSKIDANKLADHLQNVGETVLKQLGLPKQNDLRGTLIVFDRDADYRQFVPRLGAYWNAQAAEPKSGGFTVQAIATTAYSERHGTLRPVYTHEFVHSLLARALRVSNRGEWLHEGLANYYQLRFHPQENIADIVRSGVDDSSQQLPLEELCNGKPIPMNRYWQAMTVVEMLLTDEAYRTSLTRLLEAFGSDGSTDLGPRLKILEKDWTSLTEDWKRFCLRQYAP